MTNSLLNKAETINIIPQKEPFVFVDELMSHSETHTQSCFKIPKEHVFVEASGEFAGPGLIENMAQTAAIRSGYTAKLKNEKPKVGFIANVKNFEVNQYPQTGDTLITTVEDSGEIMGIKILLGNVMLNNKIIASGEIRVFLKDD